MGALTIAMKGINFWATSLVCVIILLLPTLTTRFYAFDVKPSLSDRIRLKYRMKSEKGSGVKVRTCSAKRPRRSIHSGYAFSHHVSQGKVVIVYYLVNGHFLSIDRRASVG